MGIMKISGFVLAAVIMLSTPVLGQAQPNSEAYRKALREVRQLRASHLRSHNEDRRKEGILLLAQFDEQQEVQAMVKMLEDERLDVVAGMCDQLMSLENNSGDAALAWLSVYSKKQEVREIAQSRTIERMATLPEPTHAVQSVLAEGLKDNTEYAGIAAQLANNLDLIQAIPEMISAQIDSRAPLVATSCTIMSPTEILELSYRKDVHEALVDLTTRAWGKSTEYLYYNQPAWAEWYSEQFLPDIHERPSIADSSKGSAR